jgi:hypothetical protein
MTLLSFAQEKKETPNNSDFFQLKSEIQIEY